MLVRPALDRKIWLFALALSLSLVSLLYHRPSYRLLRSLDWTSQTSSAAHHQAQLDFWQALELLLRSNAPHVRRPLQAGNAPSIGYDATHENERPDLLYMTDEDVSKVKIAHENYLYSILIHPPLLVYRPKTRGIVSTAGGFYLPILVISLRMLRRTGCTLPMEVFLASYAEYEPYICEHALPALNARCIILADILSHVPSSVSISRYQLKAFAMLFSTFESLLFLDADSFPVQNPTRLFASEPFLSHGLVVWPDFWVSSTAPFYHLISSTAIPPTTLRASSEAGEILLSKKTHPLTLLLAAYYNYYGPALYYPLLSQGGPGEGDKETFLAAALATHTLAYAVSEPVLAIGHTQDGAFAGSAMVQHDPEEDYRLTQSGLWRTRNASAAAPPKPFFLHVNHPKFDPAQVFDDRELLEFANGTARRTWTDGEETMDAFGGDVEKWFWEEIKGVSCELEGKVQDWVGVKDVCWKAERRWRALFEEGDVEG